MRTQILIVLAALLATPFAVAGPGADVQTLTSSSSCDTASSSYYDGQSYEWGYYDENGTYVPGGYGGWYNEQQSDALDCASSSQLASASASDDNGQLASASVGNANSTSAHHQRSGSGSYDYAYDGSSGYSSGWGQHSFDAEQFQESGARASVLATDAFVGTRCEDHAAASGSSYGYYSRYGNDTSYRSDREDQDNQTSRCFQGAEAAQAGHGVSGGLVNGCSQEGASRSSTYYQSTGNNSSGNATYGWSYGNGEHASDCRSGVAADGDGAPVFAGTEDACDGRDYWQNGGRDSDQRCFDGIVVEGPQGLRVALGQDSNTHEMCNWGSCSTSSWTTNGVTWRWDAAPVGGLQQGGAWLPLLS